ncbi:MAG: SoxR reducing system RseC family protein [Pseudomonadota bacterium]
MTVDAESALLAVAPSCEGCAGCSGRCHGIVAGIGGGSVLRLARSRLPSGIAVGDALLLRVAPADLVVIARRLYGVPLAGMLVGALGAIAFAPAIGGTRDALVALGAMAGLAAGIAGAALIGARASPQFTLIAQPSPDQECTPCATQTGF